MKHAIVPTFTAWVGLMSSWWIAASLGFIPSEPSLAKMWLAFWPLVVGTFVTAALTLVSRHLRTAAPAMEPLPRVDWSWIVHGIQRMDTWLGWAERWLQRPEVWGPLLVTTTALLFSLASLT